MFCKKCGKEVENSAEFCKFCGTKVVDETNEPKTRPTYQHSEQRTIESSAIGILAIIFGAFGGLLGLIFSIIGLSIYKEPQNRTNCKIGLGLFVGWIVIVIILALSTRATSPYYY